MRTLGPTSRTLHGLVIVMAGAALLFVSLPVWAELQLQSAAADRVYYEPGAEAEFTVVVANHDDQPAGATLRVELIRDLDTLKTLVEKPLTVPAKGQETWEAALKLPAVLGMELRAPLGERGTVQTAG